ncbi:MAG: VWA domain-containing protein [Gammaproteobacteria bacterium]|nr:VWA domain-containing protein [Gammaproteobacteria bacterium]
MAKKRTQVVTFGLSFLDIMSCGLGAVVLLFLIIKHNTESSTLTNIEMPDLSSEVSMLEKEILEGREGLAELLNTIAEVDNRVVTAQGLARRITEDLEDRAGNLEEALASAAQDSDIEKLKQDLQRAELERQRQEAVSDNTGADTRSYVGEGNRQYLTGLKLGGNRVLVLLDASASMLEETIVNIIRTRNMSDEVKRNAPKWLQALEMVEWLSTRFPVTSKYQIYTFDTAAESIVPNTKGQWLNVSDSNQLEEAFEGLKTIVPQGGTSLENVFTEISRLSPQPDNIYLLTDGLPTQGRNTPRGATVSGRNRMSLFESAIENIPSNIPVNVILLPMEGDPMAASAYWQLSQITGGSFMSPSEDWP